LGPNALGQVSQEQVEPLAELGVALLLFSIGLEFSFGRLRKLGAVALLGGTAQVVFTLLLGAGVALLFRQSFSVALAIGAIVALSSTACVLRLLMDRSEMDSVHGRNALGILLLQDLAVVPLVLLVTILGEESAGPLDVMFRLLTAAGLAAVLFGVLFVLFKFVVPALLGNQVMQRNRELPILLAIVSGLGAAWAAHQFKLSPALGAFIAGMILAESPFATQIRADVTSLRTLLMTLFFSAVGMLADPTWMIQHLHWVIPVVLAMVVGKAAVILVILRCFKQSTPVALATGITLAQVGEFSFVLAQGARGTLINDTTFLLMISATIITLFLTPYLIAIGPALARRMAKSSVSEDEQFEGLNEHILLVGYGPAGQAVAQSLREDDYDVVVVDLGTRSIKRAQEHGYAAYVGDASNPNVLEHLHVDRAYAIIITIPDPKAARSIILEARAQSPRVYIMVRARYHVHRLELVASGAHVVLDEEQCIGERLGVELTRHILSLD
ncbi:MAG: cation:proton antiporter, partial [Planctomycetota bacterium]